jgi:threonyl-tRNA synthetase
MIELKFPDGAVRQYPAGSTGRDVAAAISPSLAKKAALVVWNGEQRDLDRVIDGNGDFRLLMRDDPEALETIRHDAAHVLAQAVQELFPGTQVTIGPAIEDGFYYDFARDEPFSTDDFAKIEKKMAEIIDRGAPLERQVWDRDTAIKHFESVGETYKAEKRDHRKLGRAMELFHMQEEGRGMVFWHPKGWVLWRVLEAYMRRRLDASGYVEVKTPQVLDRKFWEASGHWEKYRPNMFVCETVEGETLSLKPMNCPGHVQIFDQGQRSYRELPLRMAEFGACHRYEPSGSLHGLMRVRGFTQDDAHIFCREDQIVDETAEFIKLAQSVHADLGMETAYINLATRPEVRAGSDEFWDKAEAQMAEAARHAGVEVVIAEGDGAFYAPKLDFIVKDAIGREWTCGTIQLDYVLPDRLDATYIAEDGQKHRPVMLHRAILGSFERFIGIMIENYAGAFPLWLAPTQAVVATITSDADGYAEEVAAKFRAAGLRVETDLRNEKINYKIREHSVGKVPAIAVVGRKEAEEGKVAIRRLGSQAQTIVTVEEAIAILTDEALAPDLKRIRDGQA